MKTNKPHFIFKAIGKEYKGWFHVETYQRSGARAVELVTETTENGATFLEPWARVSVNESESGHLPDGVFFAKNYSENEGLPEELESLGLIESVAAHCAHGLPAYRLTDLGKSYAITKADCEEGGE
jgi:hypothetical protein